MVDEPKVDETVVDEIAVDEPGPHPSGYISAINARAKFHDSFCTITFYFNWPNFLSVGIVNVAFQSAGTGQICHAHRAFKVPLRTFSGKLRTFPTVKSKTIRFLLHQTQ